MLQAEGPSTPPGMSVVARHVCHSQGPASPFHAHIASLPATHDCPFAWSEAEFLPLLETGGWGLCSMGLLG